MKRSIFFIVFVVANTFSFCQNVSNQYADLVKKAESFYEAKEYQKAATTLSEAIHKYISKVPSEDRYNVSCFWALANYPDSAFYHLYKIESFLELGLYKGILTDQDLKSLYTDNRWKPILEKAKAIQEKVEANFNKPLAHQLDSIYVEDQKYRKQIEELVKKYSWESKEMQAHIQLMHLTDSMNLIAITNILDKHGWLGSEVVGEKGNSCLFLVIQHGNLVAQEKYLPMMREAVKHKQASPAQFALLVDRVSLRQGKKQIYGSQIGIDRKTKLHYVSPLEDPDNVDNRRFEVGLPPLAEYLKNWELKWDVEQYKKDLPDIELKEKGSWK